MCVGEKRGLDVEIGDIVGIVLDENSARFDNIAHEGRKDVIGVFCMTDFDLQKGSCGLIHGGFPELFGVHFPESFVALYFDAVSPLFENGVVKSGGLVE